MTSPPWRMARLYIDKFELSRASRALIFCALADRISGVPQTSSHVGEKLEPTEDKKKTSLKPKQAR